MLQVIMERTAAGTPTCLRSPVLPVAITLQRRRQQQLPLLHYASRLNRLWMLLRQQPLANPSTTSLIYTAGMCVYRSSTTLAGINVFFSSVEHSRTDKRCIRVLWGWAWPKEVLSTLRRRNRELPPQPPPPPPTSLLVSTRRSPRPGIVIFHRKSSG